MVQGDSCAEAKETTMAAEATETTMVASTAGT